MSKPHLLRRIELNGFKSFAGKTVIDLPQGITAVVGPNGSGKSNVVDAIRWLLGERDAKSLRGGKIDDLIFAGTPKRARVGQATAKITFDNSTGILPIDAPEVVITRTVSRDGTSKYLLNNNDVLLRELIDILARARLGARGLAVITQGNSDVFIRSTPEKRREMIEELLGLKEYQLKKHHAGRKLARADTNLNQAQLLAGELQPQVRRLKKQLSRFNRREEIQKEVTEGEDRLYGGSWRAITEEKGVLVEKLASHQIRRPELEKAQQEALAEKARIESQSPKERQELKELQGSLMELIRAQSGFQAELGKLEMQVTMVKTQEEEKSGPPTGVLRQFVGDLKGRLSRLLSGSSDEMKSGLESLMKDIDGLFTVTVKQEAAPDHGALKKRQEELRQKLTAGDAESVQLKEKIAVLEKSQESFYTAFSMASQKADTASKELSDWQRNQERFTFQEEQLKEREQILLERLKEIGREPASLSQDVAPLDRHAADTLERALMRKRGELMAIGELDEDLVKDAAETEERYETLVQEIADLEDARRDLVTLIEDLDRRITREFSTALTKISAEFSQLFHAMFGGGTARLVPIKTRVTDEDDEEEIEELQGIDIEVSLPKKRANSLNVLSGGERSLVGLAALFALISISPPPFLVLDEIDAPLDDANARRFGELLRSFSDETQFVIVTHNRATMEAADSLYGVTLEGDGSSKVVSLKLT